MRKKVADILSDQDLYSVEKIKDLENWNKKFSEIDEAINRAEKLWIQAQQNFEKIKLSANK
jgi:ATP-binding cassette subfamily F protein 3